MSKDLSVFLGRLFHGNKGSTDAYGRLLSIYPPRVTELRSSGFVSNSFGHPEEHGMIWGGHIH
jgi:hypothetical protein